jgi:hypothetical protein
MVIVFLNEVFVMDEFVMRTVSDHIKSAACAFVACYITFHPGLLKKERTPR